MNPDAIEKLIREHLPVTTLEVMSDDNVHFEALVVSEAFEGKRLVARHQLVYGALGEHMKADIHALSIKALTPSEFTSG